MALTNAEIQARWRARHPDKILARREVEHAAARKRMAENNPWIHGVPKMTDIFPDLPELDVPRLEDILPPKRRR